MHYLRCLLRIAFCIGCLFSASAWPAASAGCEYKIEPGKSSLRVLSLSASVYACMTASDYRDVQVLNGDGNPVPIYVVHPSAKGEFIDFRKSLHFYIDHIDTNRRYHEHMRHIMHRSVYRPNGASYDSWAQRHNYPASIIVENSDTQGKLNRLMVDIDHQYSGSISASVYLQYSNDLSHWSSSSDTQQLIYLKGMTGDLDRKWIVLGANKRSRYLRIVILSNIPDFAESITKLEGTYQRTQFTEPEYVWTEASSIQMLSNGQDWQFSVPDQLPVSRLRFQPENGIVYYAGQVMSKPIQKESPEDNAYLGLRDGRKKKLKQTLQRIVRRPERAFESMNTGWRGLARFKQLHFDPAGDDDGDVATVPEPVYFPHQASRHWRIKFDHPSAAMIETKFPVVEFGWTSAHIRFLAQGPEPFVLQTGVNSKAAQPGSTEVLRSRSSSFETVALLSGDENPVKSIQLGSLEGQSGQGNESGSINRRLAIWILLIAGVLVMAYMAWQLLRSIDNKDEEDA